MLKLLSGVLLGGALGAVSFSSVYAHDIYTGVHGRNGQLCCGGEDCAATSYRERGGQYEFLTRERQWIAIPEERITFLPVPGDPPNVHIMRISVIDRRPTAIASPAPRRTSSRASSSIALSSGPARLERSSLGLDRWIAPSTDSGY
jgi:hypothetical protein